MAQNASVNKRSGDEYYTKSETVKLLIERYIDIFKDYDFIWIPFNSVDKPICVEFKKFFGNDKIITLPDSCCNDELGYNDFFKWKDDYIFYDFIMNNKVLLFDNPPFSLWSKIVKEEILPNNLNYILFGDSMTALNRVNSFNCGYRILGRVPFENCDSKKRINIALFSNLWSDIKYEFGIGTDRADNSWGKMEWTTKVNIDKYKNRDGEIASAEIINVCLRNYVFNLKQVDKNKKSKKFGGGIFYNF